MIDLLNGNLDTIKEKIKYGNSSKIDRVKEIN
jgi:hypothetical protein